MPMSISSSSIFSKIAKLEKELNELKLKVKPSVNKPKKIEDCESRDQLELFTLTELKDFLKKKEINVRRINEKHKSDFVEIVWENISDEYESDYSDEEEDEWEYYYE